MRKRELAAQRAVLVDENTFNNDYLSSRKRLIEATSRSAVTEEQREGLLRDEINAEADTARARIANRLKSGDLTTAQALQLGAVNEAVRQQRLANVDTDRARRVIDRQFDVASEEASARVDILRIQQDMAVTEGDRQRIGREILELEQQQRRKALERVAATSDDPDAVQRAKNGLKRLPELEQAEDRQFERQTAGPIDQYRQRVKAATQDVKNSLQNVAVQGFGKLEEAGSRATAQAVTDLLGLKGAAADVVGSVIADLSRLAIQKAIVASIGGGFFGFADGGRPIDAPGFADGGSPGGLIRGPGGGRSDSILALLSGGKGAIRVSNREFIVNAAATSEWLPELAAINSGRLRKFADGGSPGLSTPSMPRLREPRPNMARLRVDRGTAWMSRSAHASRPPASPGTGRGNHGSHGRSGGRSNRRPRCRSDDAPAPPPQPARSIRLMPLIDLPTSPVPSGIEWELDQPGQRNEAEFTGTARVTLLPAAPRWFAKAKLPPIIGEANVLDWRAFVVDLDGIANSFRLTACERDQLIGVTPVVDGAGQGGFRLATRNWGGPGLKLKRGQFVTVNNQLLMLMAPVVADANGRATLSFKPYLRFAPEDGAGVEARRPYAVVSSVDTRNGWKVGIGQNYEIEFSVREAF
ncbi:hypothetical protein P0F65_13460 [Sphingomonas sp. I4]